MINKWTLLIGSAILLFCGSCQPEKKTSRINPDSAAVSTEVKKEPVQEQAEAGVGNRQNEGGVYRRHIPLDFAQSAITVTDTSLILTVDSVCAISVLPDTTWMNEQQKTMGEDWGEVVSDNQYYEQLATGALQKHGITTNFANREKRFINFIKADKASFMLDLEKMKDAWGLILFNGTDNPVLWHSTDIDEELKSIYKISTGATGEK